MPYNFNIKNKEAFSQKVTSIHLMIMNETNTGKISGRLSSKLEVKDKKTVGDRLPLLQKILSALGLHVMSRTDEKSVARAIKNLATSYARNSKKKGVPAEGFVSVSDKTLLLDCVKKLKAQASDAGVKNLKVFDEAVVAINSIEPTETEATPKKKSKAGAHPPKSSTPPKTELEETKEWLEDKKELGFDGLTKLHAALGRGEFEAAKLLAEKAVERDLDVYHVKAADLVSLALTHKQPEIAKLLLERGASGESAFELSIENLQLDDADFLFQQGVNANPTKWDQIEWDQTLLERIILDNAPDLKVVNFLLERGGAVKNKYLATVINNKRFDIADALITKGLSLEFKETYGETTIANDLLNNKSIDFEIAKYVIEKGANFKCDTILNIFKNKRFDIADLLTSKHLDVKSEYGFSTTDMLMDDYKSVDEQTIKYLVKKGANLNKDHLLMLMRARRFDLAQILIDEKKVNPKKMILTDLITRSSKNTEIIEFLLKNKANVNLSNHNNTSPLYRAIVCNDLKMAQLLIDHGADLQALDDHFNSPLHHVIEKDNLEGFKLLIEARIKKHGKELGLSLPVDYDDDLPPMFVSISYINLPMVKFLQEKGARLDTTEVYGDDKESLLHAAINMAIAKHSGSTQMIKFLIENGVNQTIKNGNGLTPKEAVQWLKPSLRSKLNKLLP